jgi:putative transposase
VLEAADVAISMDGRGRALDNVFIERLWRTVKYENIYLHGYETAVELERGLASYFDFYRYQRLHMALGYRTPWEAYAEGRPRRRNEKPFGAKNSGLRPDSLRKPFLEPDTCP